MRIFKIEDVIMGEIRICGLPFFIQISEFIFFQNSFG